MLGQRVWLGIGVAGVLAARTDGGAESIRIAPQFTASQASAGVKVFGAARAQQGRRVTARLDGALALLPPASAKSGGSGGGSLDEISLLVLGGALLRRRRPVPDLRA